MFTYTKEVTVSKTLYFTDKEMEELIKDYKKKATKDHEDWHMKDSLEDYLKDIDTLYDYMEENYMWDLNEYKVGYSETNISDFYSEIEDKKLL